jgi:hypothetical protein
LYLKPVFVTVVAKQDSIEDTSDRVLGKYRSMSQKVGVSEGRRQRRGKGLEKIAGSLCPVVSVQVGPQIVLQIAAFHVLTLSSYTINQV